MTWEVYRYLLLTYGSRPAYWVSLLAELIRSLLARVVLVVIVAHLAANLATHHFPQARHTVLIYFIASAGSVLIGIFADLVGVTVENVKYGELAIGYHHKLTNKDMAFYRDHQGGYLVSLFRQHLDGVMALVRFIRQTLIRAGVSLLLPPLVLLTNNWRIGLVALGVIAIQIIYMVWASAKIRPYRKDSHEIYRRITGEVSDEITNIVAFKSSGASQQANRHIVNMMHKEVSIFQKRHTRAIFLDLPRDLLTSIAIASAFFLTVLSANNSAQALSLLVMTITYMFQINRTVADLPNLLQQHDDLITKIYPTLIYLGKEDEKITDPINAVEFRVHDGSLSFSHVNFDYPTKSASKKDKMAVFEDFNLDISPGEHLGIVGLSGAGKSTLANLLMRFDDIQGGSISIDGTDIREVRQDDLRRQIAYVPQEPLLFHRTIRENIAYFNDKATQDDIEQAAKVAHAHDFIMGLPDGYDSMVGDRGVKLSGGQKQRVAIARAILKHAPIMVFDEATSALDSESEKIIQKALPQIISRQTAIVIAHRLSTIQHMDRIAVMENGKIIQLGSHRELLKDKNGRYARLWAHQSAELDD
ncbi:MAG TPA: ABC transporter ATP-binding protein [Candidatus Saccharimonadales bacterium]|nr:ABC transporter ATP-binding protein [Candidatus Saccharimonadales bacterium]